MKPIVCMVFVFAHPCEFVSVWSVGRSVGRLVGWLSGCLVAWLVKWLAAWLSVWLRRALFAPMRL